MVGTDSDDIGTLESYANAAVEQVRNPKDDEILNIIAVIERFHPLIVNGLSFPAD